MRKEGGSKEGTGIRGKGEDKRGEELEQKILYTEEIREVDWVFRCSTAVSTSKCA